LLISEKATELLATSDWPRFAALSTGIRRLYYHKREREGERERERVRESTALHLEPVLIQTTNETHKISTVLTSLLG
jgi:hypothetical protein